jgi:hypothetical protein
LTLFGRDIVTVILEDDGRQIPAAGDRKTPEFEMRLTQAAAGALGLRLRIVSATLPPDIEEAFTQVARSGGLQVNSR